MTKEVIARLREAGKMLRMGKKKNKEELYVWTGYSQPSWLVGKRTLCEEVVKLWYKDCEWTMGEWGVNRSHTYIFDEDWSEWIEGERDMIYLM